MLPRAVDIDLLVPEGAWSGRLQLFPDDSSALDVRTFISAGDLEWFCRKFGRPIRRCTCAGNGFAAGAGDDRVQGQSF
jgi:hypothetical protein